MERSAPGQHGYPHTSDLIRVKALEGRMCHQITDVTVRPFLHFVQSTRRPRQESQRADVNLAVRFWPPLVDRILLHYAAVGRMRAS